MSPQHDLRDVSALLFDVFGTVVDWREGVAAHVTRFLENVAPHIDPHDFADRWRAEYQPAMERVRNGSRDFTPLDVLHRENLDRVIDALGINPERVPESEREDLNQAWHRLDPWSDVLPGLTRLREHFIIAPMSNANIRLALDMAKRARLPWDAILGAEVVHAYKPQPEAYQRTAEILGLAPHQVAMVAAHNDDLAAARESGMKTVFIPRTHEHGLGQTIDLQAEQSWDLIARDFTELATCLTGKASPAN